ncbi:MAG TPA: NAD(P)-dependent oxidoreductase [Steroidobacteraceae bacterium]|nr:NAD(P)-dependent oxidoreductase [Steroidobacteraceae bacterium]
MATVAFLGLGRMGLAMATRLLESDGLLESSDRLHVFNRTASRADPLIARGARRFATAREACMSADVVLSMVADECASRAMWLGPDGALEGNLAPRALAIECSTLSHGWVLELCAIARSRGLRYIDAPVTGLAEMAERGELTLLVGAESADLTAAEPVLARLACRTIRFGPPGTGTAYKLLVNMLGAVQIASAAEMMAIAERVGLDLATVADALATGQAASPQVVRNARRIVDGHHERDILFTPQLRVKDVQYALELARGVGIGSPFGTLAGLTFRELCALGNAPVNESKVIDIARTRTAE